MEHTKNSGMVNNVEIPVERFAELIAAETELNAIKAYLRDKAGQYIGLSHGEVETLCKLFGIELKTEK